MPDKPMTILELVEMLQDLVAHCGCGHSDPVYLELDASSAPVEGAVPLRTLRVGDSRNPNIHSRAILLKN